MISSCDGASDTRSIKAVLVPPCGFVPRNWMVCVPAGDREIRRLVKTITGADGGDQTDLRRRRPAPRFAGSGSGALAAHWAAWNEMLYEPAARLTDWLMLPLPWRKATWVPSGALGLPEVKLLPLLAMPAAPENCQDEPVGANW